MKNLQFLLFFALLFSNFKGRAQAEYSLKVESGYLLYQFNTVQVDAGPDWKGYYLTEERGIELSVTNGFDYNEKFHTGLGVGYLNFEGVNGISAFSDFEYLPFKWRLAPLLNLKLGYTHLWNQYANGTGSFLGEIALGLNFRLNESLGIFAKSGCMMTQQAFVVPVRLGCRF